MASPRGSVGQFYTAAEKYPSSGCEASDQTLSLFDESLFDLVALLPSIAKRRHRERPVGIGLWDAQAPWSSYRRRGLRLPPSHIYRSQGVGLQTGRVLDRHRNLKDSGREILVRADDTVPTLIHATKLSHRET
jgi:hypothetical protein